MVTTDGSDVSVRTLGVLMEAMVAAWQPVMAVVTTRELALADPVSGWEIPTGQQLWLAGEAGTRMQNGGSPAITVQPAGTGVLVSTVPGVGVETVVTDMRRALADAGLVEIPH